MPLFPEIRLDVCSVCQNDCVGCAHGEIRRQRKGHQLSLLDLIGFIGACQTSGYFFEKLTLSGAGEPLLWENLNPGLNMLKKAGIGQFIIIHSNGLGLNRLNPSGWEAIDEICLSDYGGVSLEGLLPEQLKKISRTPKDEFWQLPGPKDFPLPTPCICTSPGPVVLGDKVLLICGFPGFTAAQMAGVELESIPGMITLVKPGFLAECSPEKAGRIPLCAYCWANGEYLNQAPRLKHEKKGGGFKTRMKTL